MKWVGVIPARLGSTRLPQKVLSPIRGLPMVEWVWRRAKRCEKLQEVWVATDSSEIKAALDQKGIPVMMTSTAHASGTDRLAEAAHQLSLSSLSLRSGDWILNLQGDEPLVDPAHLSALIDHMSSKAMGRGEREEAPCLMGTLMTRLSQDSF